MPTGQAAFQGEDVTEILAAVVKGGVNLDPMSHFRPAIQSDWFNKCLDHLEEFRTPSGTYCFPSNYLIDKKDGFYVLGGIIGLEDKRTKKSLELESTFRMLLIKKRIGQLNR